MTVPWHEWCDSDALALTRNTVTLDLGRGRRHRVRVTDLGAELLLTAIVERDSWIDEEFWTRNRTLRLCGIELDDSDRLVVESRVMQAGLTADDFLFLLRHVAVTADRLEAELSVEDVE